MSLRRCLPVLLLAACGPVATNPPDAGSTTDAGTTAPHDAVAIDVMPGGTVTAPGTKLVFAFPEGAMGTLDVQARPDLAPPTPGAAVVEIGFSNANPVSLVLTRSHPDDTVQLFAYGNVPGILEGGPPRATRWSVVPKRADDGTRVTYDLPLPVPQALAPDPSQTLYGTAILPADPREAALRAKVTDALTRITALASEPLQAVLAARREQLGLEIAFDDSGSAYSGFTWGPLSGTRAVPVLALRRDATDDVVAHEVGHYVTHLIAGDRAYRAIQDAAPDENHGVGELQGRGTITEDYAYFVEFLLGYNRPCNAPRSMFGAVDPAKKDVPGLEGFGCVMLAMVGGSSGVDWAGSFGAGRLGLSDADTLGLYRSGAVTIPQLLDAITALATERGVVDRLPVSLETIGWSYGVRGSVHEADGTPVKDAKVTVRKDNSAMTPATTDATGAFKAKRFGPGKLVVTVNTDSEDHTVEATIDAARPTTDEVDVGDLRLRDDIRSFSGTDTAWTSFGATGEFPLDWSVNGRLVGTPAETLTWTRAEFANGNPSIVLPLKSTKETRLELAFAIGTPTTTQSTYPWVHGDGSPDGQWTVTLLGFEPFLECFRTDACGPLNSDELARVDGGALVWSGRHAPSTEGEIWFGMRRKTHIVGKDEHGVVKVEQDQAYESKLGWARVFWR